MNVEISKRAQEILKDIQSYQKQTLKISNNQTYKISDVFMQEHILKQMKCSILIKNNEDKFTLTITIDNFNAVPSIHEGPFEKNVLDKQITPVIFHLGVQLLVMIIAKMHAIAAEIADKVSKNTDEDTERVYIEQLFIQLLKLLNCNGNTNSNGDNGQNGQNGISQISSQRILTTPSKRIKYDAKQINDGRLGYVISISELDKINKEVVESLNTYLIINNPYLSYNKKKDDIFFPEGCTTSINQTIATKIYNRLNQIMAMKMDFSIPIADNKKVQFHSNILQQLCASYITTTIIYNDSNTLCDGRTYAQFLNSVNDIKTRNYDLFHALIHSDCDVNYNNTVLKNNSDNKLTTAIILNSYNPTMEASGGSKGGTPSNPSKGPTGNPRPRVYGKQPASQNMNFGTDKQNKLGANTKQQTLIRRIKEFYTEDTHIAIQSDPYTYIFGPFKSISDANYITDDWIEANITGRLVIPYGISGAGKTHMLFNIIIPSLLKNFKNKNLFNVNNTLTIQYIELKVVKNDFIDTTNTSIFSASKDILNTDKYSIIRVETKQDLTIKDVNNFTDLMLNIKKTILSEYRVKTTPLNPESSRSHIIVRINKQNNGSTTTLTEFCDLAGYEPVFQCEKPTDDDIKFMMGHLHETLSMPLKPDQYTIKHDYNAETVNFKDYIDQILRDKSFHDDFNINNIIKQINIDTDKNEEVYDKLKSVFERVTQQFKDLNFIQIEKNKYNEWYTAYEFLLNETPLTNATLEINKRRFLLKAGSGYSNFPTFLLKKKQYYIQNISTGGNGRQEGYLTDSLINSIIKNVLIVIECEKLKTENHTANLVHNLFQFTVKLKGNSSKQELESQINSIKEISDIDKMITKFITFIDTFVENFYGINHDDSEYMVNNRMLPYVNKYTDHKSNLNHYGKHEKYTISPTIKEMNNLSILFLKDTTKLKLVNESYDYLLFRKAQNMCNNVVTEGRNIVAMLNDLGYKLRNMVTHSALRSKCNPSPSLSSDRSATPPHDMKLLNFFFGNTAFDKVCLLGVINPLSHLNENIKTLHYIDLYDIKELLSRNNFADLSESLRVANEDKLAQLYDSSTHTTTTDLSTEKARHKVMTDIESFNRNTTIGMLELIDSIINGTTIICRTTNRIDIVPNFHRHLPGIIGKI